MNCYIVIVLYRTKLHEAATINSLLSFSSIELNILVYDNSPEGQCDGTNFKLGNLNITYVHDKSNPGISHAYNYALRNAYAEGFNWLLLLDQDTNLTRSYMEEVSTLNLSLLSNDVVCVIPYVKSIKSNAIICPSEFSFGGFCHPVNLSPGIINKSITGINSGTILNVGFMLSIDGFSLDFKLDMLDHWYFREIFRRKKSVLLLESTIYQNFSFSSDFERNFQISRYQTLLYSEAKYLEDEGFYSLVIYKIRLLIRAIRQLNYENKQYFKFSINHLTGRSIFRV
jgi:GT2 family glycosyltransferase